MLKQCTPHTTEDTIESPPSSRAEAKAVGAKMYFTGKPCPNGHLSPRFTSNYGCSECLRLQCREYHERHKDRENARCREYAKRDPKANTRRSMKWYRENREKVLDYHHRRYRENPEIKKRSSRAWYHANPDRVAVHRHIRRLRERRSGGMITAEEWRNIRDRYGNRCLCCGREDVKIVMDHVIPLSRGGTHTADNVQPLCGPCNQRKYISSTDYRKLV